MPRKTKDSPLKDSKFTTVSIPFGLIKRIDEVVANGKYGYKNRPDFVNDAIRKKLKDLGLLE